MQWINQEEGVPIMEASMVSEEDKTYTQTQLGVNNSTISCERKILGLNWDIQKDTFMFYFGWVVQFARELQLNKCSVLKVVAKLYDLISSLIICTVTYFVQFAVSVEYKIQDFVLKAFHVRFKCYLMR